MEPDHECMEPDHECMGLLPDSIRSMSDYMLHKTACMALSA